LASVRAVVHQRFLDAEMVAIAGAIIRQRTDNFDPSTYRDRYQEALPGVPNYYIWVPGSAIFDDPFPDWRGPTGGWGNP